jgi:uncharacterized coiled-coil protein SlyX
MDAHEEEMIAEMKTEVKRIWEKIEAKQQKMDAWLKKMEASQEKLETKTEACLEVRGQLRKDRGCSWTL